jgi:hypothetical protein
MHAVGEIDVQKSWLAEHRAVAGCLAPERVRGGVLFTPVRLDLDDYPSRSNSVITGSHSRDQDFSEQ